MVTKYASATLCAYYGFKALKKTVKSAKLLVPIGPDLKLMDLVKFPFNLAVKFPFAVLSATKTYLLAGGFGVTAYVLHKIGV